MADFLLGVLFVNHVTQILHLVERGDPRAAEELLPLVYSELRHLASSKMALQPPGQTLQPTALVHEAWLKLVGGTQNNYQNRQHFFRAAAEAMRQILIDRARRRLRVRHGQNAERLDVDELEIALPTKEDILLQLDDALGELVKVSSERAEIVKLRFFVGLNEQEIAEVLGISERSVQRQWSYARAWLFARIESLKSS